MNTRTGKIARLPRIIREQLNQKLEDGVAGPALLKWLNRQPPVQDLLRIHFSGEPINAQNLSAWRQGGFVDWQRHQQSRELARDLLGEMEEIEAETEGAALADRVSQMAALLMGRLLREAMACEGPERRDAVLKIARELSRLRHADRAQERMAMQQELHERSLDEAQRQEDERLEYQVEKMKAHVSAQEAVLRREYAEGIENNTLSPERYQQLKKVFARLDAHHAEMARRRAKLAELEAPYSASDAADQKAAAANSSQIKVDQGIENLFAALRGFPDGTPEKPTSPRPQPH